MNGSTKLFKIFGIQLQVHFSWWFIFLLLAWSLATAFFPQFYPDLSTRTYWLMGIAASVLLFVSVILHELSHSVVAKFRGIKVESITLFFFGGVAGITDEDISPASEFMMAIAGPLFSLVLSGIFFLMFTFNGNLFIEAITRYLYQVNFILALFNFIPGFPLDGGRAFRALLHAYYHNILKATSIAVKGGKIFAIVLMVWGILGLFTTSGGGLWFVILGGFLYFIAGASYEQVLVKDILSKVTVGQLLKKSVVTLGSEMKFSEAISHYVREEQECFPVRRGKTVIGLLYFQKVKNMSPDLQKKLAVGSLAIPIEKMKSVRPTDTGYQAFRLMTEQDADALPVMEGKTFKGLVLRRTLIHQVNVAMKYGK